jgi:hypothetical protein
MFSVLRSLHVSPRRTVDLAGEGGPGGGEGGPDGREGGLDGREVGPNGGEGGPDGREVGPDGREDSGSAANVEETTRSEWCAILECLRTAVVRTSAISIPRRRQTSDVNQTT